MKIILITPAGPTARTGNRVAAERWAGILRKLGHAVRVETDYADAPADLMIAIHAWRSAGPIERFKSRYLGARPVIIQLSGTDIYDYITSDPGPTKRSLALADRLVAINSLAWKKVPREFRSKIRLIYQSAARPKAPWKPDGQAIIVSVIGHLRDVKDPLRTAAAARLLPASSRVRVVQAGRAYSPDWAERARQEMADNPRYRWRDDLPRAGVQKLLRRSHTMVISSLSEGGANVVSEAVAAGVPILASRMDGNVGLLGPDYPGYFRVGDTAGLARLIRRIEADPAFVDRLRRAIARRLPLFAPAREFQAWKQLLAEFRPPRGSARRRHRSAKRTR